MAGGWSRPVRAVGGFLLRPWVSIILFNFAMVFWHLPGPFDLGERNQAVHIWLVHGTFFVTGVLFWLQFIPSPPFRIKMSPAAQAAALRGDERADVDPGHVDEYLHHDVLVLGVHHVPGVTLPPLRRPADRGRDLVGMRRLLGHPHHDLRHPPHAQPRRATSERRSTGYSAADRAATSGRAASRGPGHPGHPSHERHTPDGNPPVTAYAVDVRVSLPVPGLRVRHL